MKKATKTVQVGNLKIGGDNPIRIQSMCNTKTQDITATIEQILKLEEAGCEVIRITIPDMEAAEAVKEIKKQIHIPLVADIHFDHKLALKAIENGIDKVRINPGNIGSQEKIEAVVNACKEKNIPIRIGVNGGSLETDILHKHNDQATPEALVESAMRHIKILEDLDFYNTIISVKASDVITTIGAYRLLSKKVDYPLHLGVTEAGTIKSGTIKSCLGLGVLLEQGIGDTVRVSLTADPVEEIKLAWSILKNLELRERGPQFTSCPGCGRTEIDLQTIALEIEEYCDQFDTKFTIAVMGCVVNGPGEAAHADIGLIGGPSGVAIYAQGKFLESIPEQECIERIKKLIDERVKSG